jgi:hypothetical protein
VTDDVVPLHKDFILTNGQQGKLASENVWGRVRYESSVMEETRIVKMPRAKYQKKYAD